MLDTFVNIASHLPRMAREQPDALAVACPAGRDASGRYRWIRLSFRALDEESSRLARGLAEAGIGRGVRTVLMVPPSPEFFSLTFALFKAGSVPVLVDPGMGISNLKSCLDEAEPEAFIGVSKAHAARIALGWAKRTLRTTVTVGRRWFWGGRSLADLRSSDGSEYLVKTRPEETAAILFTSGSTGTPKGVVYSHSIFDSQVRMLKQMYGIRPGEIDVPTFPLFALFGPALGTSAVVPEMDFTRPGSVDPRNIVDAIREFSATQMFGSPALLDQVGRWLHEQGESIPTMRRMISAGAPVSPAVLARFEGRLASGAEIHTPYGATECLPVATIGSREILRETRVGTEEGLGVCVGRPVAEMTVKIITITDGPIADWDDSLEAPAGVVGEIVVQGPVATRRYFNRDRSTALAKIEEPQTGLFYHRMGDLGYFDQSGRLWFCGRKAHRVDTGAGTLFTVPCEGVFNTIKGVARTALVGVGNGVKKPVLCVELEPQAKGWPKPRLIQELRERGAKYAHTKGIETFLFHDSFPVDIRHNAKIFREKLARWAERRL
ncbi:MAG: peptide synthase [Elusimicrobia bacterium CG_4_9_14_3_um_filter_62_55]|nr:MAG: peptide synthase [Elusimicrobia bacterium CG22_combo_CG10-13_8_21_14_all_63_91]PJA15346.1 MAG: peptide synthase [Elusimicrobia bacterium CG_4_10_14_0_2_um_filter_63_34]PJB26969.1 MAG: peptide synthase [Elusimicrobia bacterium CG_4_9_14_3_um_filter_62_55]